MMRYKGASYSPGDLAPGKNGIKCHVVLLDGKAEIVEIHKKALASALFDSVCRNLDILEREYFGIEYEDEKKLMRWLDTAKPLKKQLKRKETRFYFKVKFYAIDPSVLQDNTRYQFFLQLKNDIAKGRLVCLPNITATVLAYVVQAEVGDYDSAVHHAGYISEFRLLPTISKSNEDDIARAHVSLIGTSPEDAEIQFLQKVKWLDRYGIQLFEVHGEERVKYYLGMGPPGLSVFRDTTRVSYYVWSKIVKVSYRRKRFIVFVRGGSRELTDSQVASFAFEVGSSKASKYIWKCCVDNIAFYTKDDKLEQAMPKSRSARFVRTSSGRYIRKNSRDMGMYGGLLGNQGNSDSRLQGAPGDMTRDFPLIPPVPPRQNAAKSGKKKKGQLDDDGDNFDEEPLFPKYENIFQFTPKEPKTSQSKDEKVSNGSPPHNSSSNDAVPSSLPHTGPEDIEDQLGYRPLSSVVEVAEEDLFSSDREDEDKDGAGHKRDYDTDDELSGSSSDSDDEDAPDDHHMQTHPHPMSGQLQPHPHPMSGQLQPHPHPMSGQLQSPPPQQQQHTQSHLIYSDEDIDNTLNDIEDEQNTTEPAWNSNSLYDRLEPIPKEMVDKQLEMLPVSSSSASGGILSRIKSRSRSPKTLKPPEGSKPPLLHQVLSPPPPPPPKIPNNQFVAPPGSSYAASTTATTDPANQMRRHTDGDQKWITTATGGPPEGQPQERSIDVGNNQVVRRQHPPNTDTSTTRNVLMAWVKEQQSREMKTSTTANVPSSTAVTKASTDVPHITVNTQPSNKPHHFIPPPEWKPPPLPTIAQRVPPPKAPKPFNTKVISISPNLNRPGSSEHPPLPTHKPPVAPKAESSDIVHTDSSSSLEAVAYGLQAPRGKSRLPPGLDIASLTRIHPEFDYNAQDFAHKDSIDRRKKDHQKDQEISRPVANKVTATDGSDSPREFIPPGGSHIDLTQQTSMEEEKEKLLAYIKNRKVETKMSDNSETSFVRSVPAEVEAKHQKKHQDKQGRKSLRDKLKRVMPNGKEKREKDIEPQSTGWQWSKEVVALPISAAETSVASTLSENSSSQSFTKVEARGSGVGMEVPSSSEQHGKLSSASSTSQASQQSSSNQLDSSTPVSLAAASKPPTMPKPVMSKLQGPAAQRPSPTTAARQAPPTAPKPSPPTAPKPRREQPFQRPAVTESLSSNLRESEKLVDQFHSTVPLQLQAARSEDESRDTSFSPPPPSETYAPPPYSGENSIVTTTSPDNAINSLLDDNLPTELQSVQHRKKGSGEKLPFPTGGSGNTRSNSKLPRYSEIEVLSPVESVGNPPAYPGNNSAEFAQPPNSSNVLQTMLADLPPPPPHLAGLTGEGQDSADGMETIQQEKQLLLQQQQQLPRDREAMSTRAIQQEIHSRTGSDLSDLPPAIASFMNRVRQSSAGSAQEMKQPDQQKQPSFSPPPLAQFVSQEQQQHLQPWNQQQVRHHQDQQYHQAHYQQQSQHQNQYQQQHQPRSSQSDMLSEIQSHLRKIPPDGSSTRSSLQDSYPPTLSDHKLPSPPYSDSSNSPSPSLDDNALETNSSISYTSSLPRPICHHQPTGMAIPMHNNPRAAPFMQPHYPSYPHSLPPSLGIDVPHSRGEGFQHGSVHHHLPPSSVASYQQQIPPHNHSTHMYNHLAPDRPLRQFMDHQRQQMERPPQQILPTSRPSPIEMGRQFQYPVMNQPPPVPPGTQRPQPLRSYEWLASSSPMPGGGRQRNISLQEDGALKERQVEAQRRLMQQEGSRRAHMIPGHHLQIPNMRGDGMYHAESLQHLQMVPGHPGSEGPWSHHPGHHYYTDYPLEQRPVGPYLHQSGGRHSYAAAPSNRDTNIPPIHHGSLQRPPPHQRSHHPSYSGNQQQPPQNHEQSDKKNFSVIQV